MCPSFYRGCLGLIIMALAGCTAQSMYFAVQETAKQHCLRQAQAEQANCQARLNKDDYDTYSKKRSTE